MQDNWFSWFTVVYQLSVVAIPIAIAVGTLWLRANYPSRQDFERLSASITGVADRATAIETRLSHLEADDNQPPTRLTLMEEMAGLSSRLAGLEATIESDRRTVERHFTALEAQMRTLNQYLHTLVERAVQGDHS
ncbi:MAG: hypothetical protein IT472_08725 [Thermomonas sp.]|uniref:hypothetical protein n=1 Tax=Thermomonas sp. TaxID=1971895 RepID=UPI002611E1AF|nr:hypothetical protein [Thermomonas sp.]MCC7097248.1 hypothetical protein [Thermomonas sp.]